MGVAELGLNLGFETPATIALRRLAVVHPAFARDLLGRDISSGASAAHDLHVQSSAHVHRDRRA